MTETTDDGSLVTSIVIYRGQDVAASIAFHGSDAKSFTPAATVTGKLTNGQGQLTMTWSPPTQEVADDYKCEIHTANSQGRSLVFGKSLKIENSDVSMGDLMEEIKELKQVARKEPNIMFSAVFTKGVVHLRPKQVVIYDRIITNVGQGYDNSTGVFTAPVTGYYHFEVHAWAPWAHDFYLQLTTNDRKIFTIDTMNPGPKPRSPNRGSSNGAYVKLQIGDKVKVSCYQSKSTVYGNPDDHIPNTFSGRLVALE